MFSTEHDDFILKLQEICKRHDMYIIGGFSEFLSFFIGWLMGLGYSLNQGLMLNFQYWVSQKFNSPPNIAWEAMLNRKFKNVADPYSAFFTLIKEFQQRMEK